MSGITDAGDDLTYHDDARGWDSHPSRRWSTLAGMLYMVIETFKQGDARRVGERFKAQGRMMPDGVVYHASWVETSGMRCFQVMESPSWELLNVWTSHWSDLVDFEIIPVQTSSEFWANAQAG